MKIIISGASGLVGTALTSYLREQGHQVTGIRRSKTTDDTPWWDIPKGILELGPWTEPDAVIHLAGENIAQGRWTAEKKDRILQSRVASTDLLARTLAALDDPPKVFVSGSAIGFYGSCGDRQLNESSPAGQGFLSEVCQQWEAAAEPARQAGIRVVHPRLGVVLTPKGGALKEMLPPFRMGLGGPIGSGTQYLSWISLPDAIAALAFLIQHEQLEGPVNLVAPAPATNRFFGQTLGKALGKPAVMPLPAFAARLLFGEKADQMLLASTRVIPTALEKAGFEFQHPELAAALKALLNNGS